MVFVFCLINASYLSFCPTAKSTESSEVGNSNEELIKWIEKALKAAIQENESRDRRMGKVSVEDNGVSSPPASPLPPSSPSFKTGEVQYRKRPVNSRVSALFNGTFFCFFLLLS